MQTHHSTWTSEVRDYEVDFQGIVNNACYFQYLAQARALHIEKMGINIVEMASQGINLVLIETNIKFQKALKYKDIFIVHSELMRTSKLKFLFIQKILNQNNNQLCVTAHSIVSSILSSNNKPFIPDQLEKIEIKA